MCFKHLSFLFACNAGCLPLVSKQVECRLLHISEQVKIYISDLDKKEKSGLDKSCLSMISDINLCIDAYQANTGYSPNNPIP